MPKRLSARKMKLDKMFVIQSSQGFLEATEFVESTSDLVAGTLSLG